MCFCWVLATDPEFPEQCFELRVYSPHSPALQTPCGCSAAAPGTHLCSLWNSAAGEGWTEDPEQEKNPGMCSGHLDPLLRKDPGQEAAAERALSMGKGPAQI